MRKLVLVVLSMMLVVIFAALLPVCASADETITVQVEGTFGQKDARDMLEIINDFRTGDEAWYFDVDNETHIECPGLMRLEYDYDLEKAAMQRAVEIAMSFSHTRPDGTMCNTAEIITSIYGENIAAGNSGTLDTFKQWKEDDLPYSRQGHRRNMLNKDFTCIGIGHVVVNNRHFWVQEFGVKSTNTIETTAIESKEVINVKVSESRITKIITDSIELEFGKKANLPQIGLQVTEIWPTYSVIYVDKPDLNWVVSTLEYFKIEDDKIIGLAAGSGKLISSLGGKDLEITVTIKPIDLSDATVTLTKTDFTYTGLDQTPDIAVKLGDTVLQKDIDYQIYYTDNRNASDEAKATIMGKGNYTGMAEATFTIAKAPLTIKANDYEITYGDQPANAGVTYDGLIDGETEKILVGTLDYNYEYNQYDGVGSYTITPAGLTSDNYEITWSAGNLKVWEKEVGISWDDTPLTYNGKRQAPTATLIGVVNNDDVSAEVSGAQKDAGSYTATVSSLSGNKAANYRLPASLSVEFTIEKVEPTVTAPMTKTGMVCTVEPQELVKAGSTDGGTMVYSLEKDGTYKETIPKASKAGNYSVWYKVHGDQSHFDTDPEEVKTSIEHVPVKDEAVAATCTEDGLTEGSHCSVCNTVIKKQEIVKATGHTEVIDEAVAATCTEDGLTEGSHCSVCNTVIRKQKTVKATGHTEVIDKAVAATCTEDGLTEGSHCSVCNTIIKEQKKVEKLGHKEVIDKAVEATTESTGLTEGKHCERCGTVLIQQIVIDKLKTEQHQTDQPEQTEPDKPQTDKPEQTEPDKPQTDKPEQTEPDKPQTDQPEQTEPDKPQTDKPEQTEPDKPQTDKPEQTEPDKPQTDKPEQTEPDKPQTDQPEQTEPDKPQTDKPEQTEPDKPQTEPDPKPEPIPVTDNEPEDKVEAFVTRCYRLILNRAPDADGLRGWSEALKSKVSAASQIIDGFVRSPEFIGRNIGNAEAVDILYKTMLNRAADAEGKAGWVDAMNQGYTLQNIIDGFCGSPEFTALCGGYGIEPGSIGAPKPASQDTPRGKIEAFVRRCYKLILNRDADEGGLKGWSDALETGAGQACQIIDGFVRSPEYINRNLDYAESVDILYLTMLDRAADEGGKTGWVDALNQGYTLQHIINGFCGSAEFTNICNEFGITAGNLLVQGVIVKREAITPEGEEEAPVVYVNYTSEYTNEEKIRAFVEHCYEAVFGREGDAEGVEAYTKLILEGKKTPKRVAYEFIFSAEFQNQLPGNENFIRILYRLYLNREPGAEELTGWAAMLENGTSLEDIVNGFAVSEEFKAIVNEMKN